MSASSSYQFACPLCQGLFQCELSGAEPAQVECPHCQQIVTVATEPMTSPPPGSTTLAEPTSGEAESDEADQQVSSRASLGKVLLILLVLAVSTGLVFLWYQRTRTSPLPTSTGGAGESSPRESEQGWADATKVALRLGNWEVRITRAELGPVIGRDAQNAVVPLNDQALQIALQVRNLAPETLEYRSWYATSILEGGIISADLVDDRGFQYALEAFGEGQKLRGHTPRIRLEPGQRVQDLLVFHIPPDLDRAVVQSFRLWLEGGAVGVAGKFQFEIPVAMVQNWRTAPAEP
jgi:hypothetical protein